MLTYAPDTAYRAQRTYVHGTDIYLCLQDAATRLNLGSEIGAVRISLRRLLTKQPLFHFYPGVEAPTPPTNAGDDFMLMVDGKPCLGWIVESSIPVTRRVAYDETPIHQGADIEGEAATLNRPPACQPIEAALSLGVLVNNHLTPPGKRRWMLARMSFSRPLTMGDLPGLSVTREKAISHVLTRARVLSPAGLSGELFFSLANDPATT